MVGAGRGDRAESGAQVAARLDLVEPTVRRRIECKGSLRLLAALGGLIAFGCVLGLLAQDAPVNSLDLLVLRFVVGERSSWMNSVAGALTHLGAPALLLVVALGLGCAWWALKATVVPLVTLMVTWLGAEVLFNAVKLIVDRPRPSATMAMNHFGGLAFPSGHATQSVAVWGMVVALGFLSTRARTERAVLLALGLTMVFAVGLTRVYLGAHWASDVLGGWLLGALWVAAVLWIVRPSERLTGDGPAVDADV